MSSLRGPIPAAIPEINMAQQSPETAVPSDSSSGYHADASARVVEGGGDKVHETILPANDNGAVVDDSHSTVSSSIHDGGVRTIETLPDNEQATTDNATKHVTNAQLQEQSDSAVFNTWCEFPPSLPEEKASEPRTPTGTTSPEKQMTPKKPPHMSPCLPAVLGLQQPMKFTPGFLPISASKASMPPAEQPRLQGFERNYSHTQAANEAPFKQSSTSGPAEGSSRAKEIIGNKTESSQKRATSKPDTIDRINHGLDRDFGSEDDPRNFNSHTLEQSNDIRDYELALEAELHEKEQEFAEQDQAEHHARELAELAEEHEWNQVRLKEAAEQERARNAEIAEAQRLQKEEKYYADAKVFEGVLKHVPAAMKLSEEKLVSQKAGDNGDAQMPKKIRTPTMESLTRWSAANPEEDLQAKIMDQYERRGVPPPDAGDIFEELGQLDAADALQMPNRTARAGRDTSAAMVPANHSSDSTASTPGKIQAAGPASSAHTTSIKGGQAAAPHDAEVESASQSQLDDDDMQADEMEEEEMGEKENDSSENGDDTARVAQGFDADYPDATYNEIVNTQQEKSQIVRTTEPAAFADQNHGQTELHAADKSITTTRTSKANGVNPTPHKFEDLIPPALEKLDTATLEAQCEALNSHYDGLLAQLLEDWQTENQKMQQWLVRGNDVQTERAWCTIGGAVGDAQKKYLKASKGRKHLAEFARRMADVQRMLLIQQQAGLDDAYSSDMEVDH